MLKYWQWFMPIHFSKWGENLVYMLMRLPDFKLKNHLACSSNLGCDCLIKINPSNRWLCYQFWKECINISWKLLDKLRFLLFLICHQFLERNCRVVETYIFVETFFGCILMSISINFLKLCKRFSFILVHFWHNIWLFLFCLLFPVSYFLLNFSLLPAFHVLMSLFTCFSFFT